MIIFNQKLGVKENIPDISLPRSSKSGNSYDFTTSFLIPKDLPPGAYPLDVTLLIRKNQDSDRQIIPFKLEKCTLPEPVSAENKAEENEPAKTLDKTVVSAAEKGLGLATGGTAGGDKVGDKASTSSAKTALVVQTVEDPYTNDDIAAALLITGMVIILAFITWMLVLLFRGVEQRTKEEETENEKFNNEEKQKKPEKAVVDQKSDKKSINKNKLAREEP